MEESLLMQCAATMGVAMVPVLELRGAIPFGLALGLPASLVYVISVIGNLIPVPAIMLFIRTLFRWLRRRNFQKRNSAVVSHSAIVHCFRRPSPTAAAGSPPLFCCH